MTVRRRTLGLIASVTLLGGLGACGVETGDGAATATTKPASSSTTSSGRGSTTTSTTPATTTTRADGPSDAEVAAAQARVEAVNILGADLDGDWTAEAPGSGAGMLEQCAQVDLDQHLPAKARSDQFSTELPAGTMTVGSTTGAFDKGASAKALMEELGGPVFAACATDGLKASLPQLLVEGEVQPTDPIPGLGDEAVGLGADLTLSGGGESGTMSVLIIAIRTGDLVTTLSTTAMDGPIDESLIYPLLDLIAERQAP